MDAFGVLKHRGAVRGRVIFMLTLSPRVGHGAFMQVRGAHEGTACLHGDRWAREGTACLHGDRWAHEGTACLHGDRWAHEGTACLHGDRWAREGTARLHADRWAREGTARLHADRLAHELDAFGVPKHRGAVRGRFVSMVVRGPARGLHVSMLVQGAVSWYTLKGLNQGHPGSARSTSMTRTSCPGQNDARCAQGSVAARESFLIPTTSGPTASKTYGRAD